MNLRVHFGLVACGLLLSLPRVSGQVIFSDNFTTGASAQWGNEVGAWTATGGVYSATAPSNAPPTYTSLPYTLTDFSFSVTINQISDGGIFLRSADNGNGVLLVTGGNTQSGTGFYWHTAQNGSFSAPLNPVSGLFVNGVDSGVVTVIVSGNTYSAYYNNTLATTLTTNLFSSGKVALYDFSNQTFDNVVLSVPEPQTLALMTMGVIGLAVSAARARKRAGKS